MANVLILWGSEDHVRELFAGVATSFEFERHVNWIEWESIEGFAECSAIASELRVRVVEIWRNANEATDGRLRLPQEYLLSIIRL